MLAEVFHVSQCTLSLALHVVTASIQKWLEGSNAHLGNCTSMDLLKKGPTVEVFEAIDALRSGAYA